MLGEKMVTQVGSFELIKADSVGKNGDDEKETNDSELEIAKSYVDSSQPRGS